MFVPNLPFCLLAYYSEGPYFFFIIGVANPYLHLITTPQVVWAHTQTTTYTSFTIYIKKRRRKERISAFVQLNALRIEREPPEGNKKEKQQVRVKRRVQTDNCFHYATSSRFPISHHLPLLPKWESPNSFFEWTKLGIIGSRVSQLQIICKEVCPWWPPPCTREWSLALIIDRGDGRMVWTIS